MLAAALLKISFRHFRNIATQFQNCYAGGKIKLLGLRYGLFLGQAGAARYGLIRVLWPDQRTIAGVHEQSSCTANAQPTRTSAADGYHSATAAAIGTGRADP